MPRSSEWLIPFRLFNQNLVHIFHLTCACYIPCLPPITSSLFGPNFLLRTVLSNSSVCVLPLMLGTRFHTHTKQHKITVFYMYFNLYVSGQQMDKQKIVNCIVASIPQISSALNLVMNTIPVC
jgi:hypothetical protein